MNSISMNDVKAAFKNLLTNKYTEQMYNDMTQPVSHVELTCGVHTLGYLYLQGFEDKERAMQEVLTRFRESTGHDISHYRIWGGFLGSIRNCFPKTVQERKFSLALYYLTLREAIDRHFVGGEYEAECNIAENPRIGQWIDNNILVKLLALATKKPAVLVTDMRNQVLIARYNSDNGTLNVNENDCDLALQFGGIEALSATRDASVFDLNEALNSGANMILLRNTISMYDNQGRFGTHLCGYYQPIIPEKNREFVDSLTQNFIRSDGMFFRNYIIDNLPFRTGRTERNIELGANCAKMLQIPGIDYIIRKAKGLRSGDQEKKYCLLKKIAFRFKILRDSEELIRGYVIDFLRTIGFPTNPNFPTEQERQKQAEILSKLNEVLFNSSPENRSQKVNDLVESLTMLTPEARAAVKTFVQDAWPKPCVSRLMSDFVVSILRSTGIILDNGSVLYARNYINRMIELEPEAKRQEIGRFLSQLPPQTDEQTKRQIKDYISNVILDDIDINLEIQNPENVEHDDNHQRTIQDFRFDKYNEENTNLLMQYLADDNVAPEAKSKKIEDIVEKNAKQLEDLFDIELLDRKDYNLEPIKNGLMNILDIADAMGKFEGHKKDKDVYLNEIKTAEKPDLLAEIFFAIVYALGLLSVFKTRECFIKLRNLDRAITNYKLESVNKKIAKIIPPRKIKFERSSDDKQI